MQVMVDFFGVTVDGFEADAATTGEADGAGVASTVGVGDADGVGAGVGASCESFTVIVGLE